MKSKLNNSISATKFKAQCLKLMDKVNETYESYVITKHNKPIAMLAPVDESHASFFGCMQNTLTIQGNIIEPISVRWKENQ